MLSDTKIRQTRYEGKPQKLTDQNGLHLLITETSKRWYLRYTFEGRRYERPLGAYPVVSLLDARQKAIDVLVALSKGVDPLANPETAKGGASITFGAAFETLYAIDVRKLASSTMQKRRSIYEKYLSGLADRPLDKITPQEIRDIVLPLHDEGKEVQAGKVRGIVSKIYTDGVIRYDLTYDPSQASRGLPRSKRQKHYPHIEDKRLLGRLLGDIERGQDRTSLSVSTALKLLPYLFVRAHELRHMHGRDIDLDEAVWRIPAEICKMRDPHIVPLARQAIGIIRNRMELIGADCYLFPSPTAKAGVIGDKTINSYLRRLGYDGSIITPHGLRGTASTALYEAGYDGRWIEKQLSHLDKDETSAAYNHAKYLPQRRKMMQEWADYLDDLRARYGGKSDDGEPPKQS